ncbi:hypothetical protein [Stenotrophomonas maltophilia]|uniref:hypothetical protein n=1 Tax=Stenotrophomonas maltophilia TaxID=40324 RepID=UPI001FF086DA|nr:hypothetical protein [Stenotrophomonas maltophilia]
MTIVNMTIDAEIDLDGLVENLGPYSKEYLTNLLKVGEAARAPDGRTFEQIIEAAFNEARAATQSSIAIDFYYRGKRCRERI